MKRGLEAYEKLPLRANLAQWVIDLRLTVFLSKDSQKKRAASHQKATRAKLTIFTTGRT